MCKLLRLMRRGVLMTGCCSKNTDVLLTEISIWAESLCSSTFCPMLSTYLPQHLSQCRFTCLPTRVIQCYVAEPYLRRQIPCRQNHQSAEAWQNPPEQHQTHTRLHTTTSQTGRLPICETPSALMGRICRSANPPLYFKVESHCLCSPQGP